MTKTLQISKRLARRIWLNAQQLLTRAPFGSGPGATRSAIEHLGYVQIDTINVIERCHHHILFSRIPTYRRDHLRQAQSVDKSVFEYWTHALAYVPTRDIRFFLGDMMRHKKAPSRWFDTVSPGDVRKVLDLIKKQGPLTIRDIDDDVLVEKDHPWASRKPSKRVLQLAFFSGDVTVSQRAGMLKSYDLTGRHFGWTSRPKPATESQISDYMLGRALRSQGLVSVNSACYLSAKRKRAVGASIDACVRRGQLVSVALEGAERVEHWTSAEALETDHLPDEQLVHILSPFDPLIIQRRRFETMFGYLHRFEAYLPKEKRAFGYFALPVLIGDSVVAAVDLKTDRVGRQLQLQKWNWLGGTSRRHKQMIEEELHRFARFQLSDTASLR